MAKKRLVGDDPYLTRTLVLGSGSNPIEIHRPDERTLLVRPEGGFIAPPGHPRFTHKITSHQPCGNLQRARPPSIVASPLG